MRRRRIDEPSMSDRTLLVSVEDLIYIAFGRSDKNIVNFKMIQSVLHILARQMRLLEQDVEIRLDESGTPLGELRASRGIRYGYDDELDTDSSSTRADGGVGGAERRKKRYERWGSIDRPGQEGKGGKGYYQDQDRKRAKWELGEKDGIEGRWERMGRGERGGKEDGTSPFYDRDGKRRYKDEAGRERKRGDRRDYEEYTRDIDKFRRGRGLERASGTSITVSETTRWGPGGKGKGEKILIAETGLSSRVRPYRIGSIDVVTASQLALLEKAVKRLEQVTGTVAAAPVLPKDETLIQDLAAGRASLHDTMEAVQLSERVRAAEQGLYRIAELLTQLAQSGMLPPEVAGRAGEMEQYLQSALAAAYAVSDLDGTGGKPGGGPDKKGEGADKPGEDSDKSGEGSRKMSKKMRRKTTTDTEGGTTSTTSRMDGMKSTTSSGLADAAVQSSRTGVTHSEIHEVLQHTKDAILKEISNLIARANHTADIAINVTRSVAVKLDIAMQIDNRVSDLLAQTAVYAEKLSGFDTGIGKLVQDFEEHIVSMRNDLSQGLSLLGSPINSAEAAAMLRLTENFETLLVELDNTVHLHQNLRFEHRQINAEVKSLYKIIRMLNEQKASRDEVLESLRNKADISSLVGLFYGTDFDQARLEIENRLANCYERFTEQDTKWKGVLVEFTDLAETKAELIMLIALKDTTNAKLITIQQILNKLEVMLGEPEMALLMRILAADAACGACLTRALMEPLDSTHGKPLPLPALRPPAPRGLAGEGEVKLAPPDIRDHVCRRWVGGSHTLMGSRLLKGKAAQVQLQIYPTKKFEGYGVDGRLYMLEEDMWPCIECNQLRTADSETGAGDHAPTPA